MRPQIGTLSKRVTFQSKVVTQEADYGTEVPDWMDFASLWANVQDVLPSRAESQANGINMQARPARLRIRWRNDITSDMRVLIEGRSYQIVAGPAELGRRDGLEMMITAYSTQGEGA